ncbi:DMT family transporter, partial [Micromonospora sp. MW-13]|uniref:DMT family transporter n=1 Tax=Micromonospora sp. MW-13 TaxID=2094022 RepID=UPI00352FBF52
MTATRRIAGVGLAVASGFAVAVQSRINGELGVRLADGIAAAVVSFGLGLLVLLVLVPATPAGRRGLSALRAALADGSLRPWQCLGGVCGAFLVASQGLTIGTLGVAVFTVAVVAGQSGSSLLVDRAGIGPAGRQAVTPNRLVGAVLTVLAVLLAVGHRLGDPGTLGLAVLPLLA